MDKVRYGLLIPFTAVTLAATGCSHRIPDSRSVGAGATLDAADFAEQAHPTPPPRELAIEILRRTRIFADTSIGYLGETSNQVLAFGVILGQSDADAIFKALLHDAEPPGQLYALCGLYFTDPSTFARTVIDYERLDDTVVTQMGCTRSRESISTIVKKAGANVVRLSSPADTTREWVRRNRKGLASGYALDISGGGYSARFKEFYESYQQRRPAA